MTNSCLTHTHTHCLFLSLHFISSLHDGPKVCRWTMHNSADNDQLLFNTHTDTDTLALSIKPCVVHKWQSLLRTKLVTQGKQQCMREKNVFTFWRGWVHIFLHHPGDIVVQDHSVKGPAFVCTGDLLPHGCEEALSHTVPMCYSMTTYHGCEEALSHTVPMCYSMTTYHRCCQIFA